MIVKVSMVWTPQRYYNCCILGLPFWLPTRFLVVLASIITEPFLIWISTTAGICSSICSLETEGPFQNVCLRVVPLPQRHLSSRLGSQTVPWLTWVTTCQFASQHFPALCLSRTFLSSAELSHLTSGKVWYSALNWCLLHSFPLFQWTSYIRWHPKFSFILFSLPNSGSLRIHPPTQGVLYLLS